MLGRSLMRRLPVAVAALCASLGATQLGSAHAQMLAPAAVSVPAAGSGARGPLTGFLSAPTDQIAVPGEAASGEITPEGDLYTGWAEYELRVGPSLRAWDQPTRTLPDPSLPLLASSLEANGMRYSQTVFAVALDGSPVAYETVTAKNGTTRTRTARVAMAVAYTKGREIETFEGATSAYRYPRPALGGPPGSYEQPGQAFSEAFSYSFDGRDLDRSGLLLARGPQAPSTPVHTATEPASPTAPHDARLYSASLRPGRSVNFTWQIPLAPPAAGSTADRILQATSPGAARAKLHALWAAQESQMTSIDLPEPKVTAAYRAAIVEILESRIRTADGWMQTPNRLQYQAFWIRDAAIESDALDLVGLHEQAAQNISFLDAFQQQDGLFISQAGQYDELGQALWAIGEHAELTDDRAYAEAQIPRVTAAIGWLEAATQADPLGLLPAADPNDNELIYGHITGDDLWAADGLRAAVALAKVAGRAELAADWQTLDARFESTLREAIAKAVARTGHIPPALDASGGQDWGNYGASYPDPILPPRSHAVQATLAWASQHSIDGLPTYGNGHELHGYLGFRLFETDLDAGDPSAALEGLYSELAHTTSTDGGWELLPAPYGSRATSSDLAPHGTFAAEYVALLRNLLVREPRRGSIALLSGASPAWLAPGERIAVKDAPTADGPISFEERSSRAGERVSWSVKLRPGTSLNWVLPAWARHARSADDGEKVGSSVLLHGGTGSIAIDFRGTPPAESYALMVAKLNAAYRAHGQPAPLVPSNTQIQAR